MAANPDDSRDPLIAALEEDAKGQASRLIEEAEEAKEEILRRARAEAEKEADERLSTLRERLTRERASILNSAKTKAAGLKLGVRQELVGSVLVEAQKRLLSLPDADYGRLIDRLYLALREEWAKARPGEQAIIRLNPADAARIRADGARVEPDSKVAGGVVLTSFDGRVVFESTVSSMIERARKLMVPAIDKLLFREALP
ncbi:MAG: hypothetical protein H3C68_04540 [Deltaproteobacteria bacterium]|nr:hypothetical protein [Deltaproteobacteria bacterium]MBZ0219994.1 V-type ATP synthase subunit E [Deltaproteobacteria bacterium]